MCEMMHCFYWRRNWWIWNFSVSSSIPHWQCSKQTPVEGALLCWSLSFLHVFQSSHVSSLYFCVFMLTLVGENCRWSETTAFLLGFPTCRSTNKFLPIELCYVEVWCLLIYFLDQVWLFNLLRCLRAETNERNICSICNLQIPSCIPNLQSHKWIFVERALPHWSLTTANIFRPGLTLLPTTMFCWCHWWEKVPKHMKLLHPLLHFPLADP